VRNFQPKIHTQVLLSIISLCVCTSAFAGFVDLIVVGVYPDARLEIADSDVKCGSDKNCIKTTKGSELEVDFRLKKACDGTEPDYKLTGMQFSMIQREPDGAGGMTKPFGKYTLPAIVTQDFNTDAKGNVIWTNGNKLSDDKIKLKNKNDGEYVVFFQVEAVHCTNSSDVILLDPRVENTGK